MIYLRHWLLLAVYNTIILAFLTSGPVFAQQPLVDQPATTPDLGKFEVEFPGQGVTGDIRSYAQREGILGFVNAVVLFITGVIVVVGLIAIVIGGYIYMTAGGSAERVGQAKVWIGSALLGIVLALAAVLILNTISPQFGQEAREPCIPKQKSCPGGTECPASGQCP